MSDNKKPIKAWHFCRADMKTKYTGEPIKIGETLSVAGHLGLCDRGLHASLHPFDALKYAPGAMLCRVEVSGDVLHGDDKICGSHRKVLWVIDADHLLHEFACLCAERALARAGVTDERSHNAIKVKRLWLEGRATDSELHAAWHAALDAAQDAAQDAARRAALDAALHAARRAALDAAQDAALHAARRAAQDAARRAAQDAARDAEEKWQRDTLMSLIKELANKWGGIKSDASR